MFRSLLQTWLHNAAQQKLREKAEQFAREQLHQAAGAQAGAEEEGQPRLCDVGVVFALEIESGGLEDLLEESVGLRGDGFSARWGRLRGRLVVAARSGAGREAAARATEALIDGHRPKWIISAGLAGGLAPQLKRHDLLVADRLLDPSGARLAVDLRTGLVTEAGAGTAESGTTEASKTSQLSADPLPAGSAWRQPGVHVGPLVTVDQVARTPEEKKALGEKHQALGADMETWAVAQACARRGLRFLSVRVIGDPVDETLAPEVRGLLKQKSGAARLGAAFGAILNRPSSVKDMYQLRENALLASDRLAKFLAEVVEELR